MKRLQVRQGKRGKKRWKGALERKNKGEGEAKRFFSLLEKNKLPDPEIIREVDRASPK